MRAVRVSLVAALMFSISSSSAQAGIFGCLQGQTITIPNWSPAMSPVYIQQQPAASNGLLDAFLIELLKGAIGGITKPTTTDNSGSLDGVNATLNRIDGKMDRLQVLVVDRLTKVESDVATVAKAQRESTALQEQRLVETIGLVNSNTKLIETNTKAISEAAMAIQRTQKETKFLFEKGGYDISKLDSTPTTTPTPVVPPAPAPTKTAKDNLQKYAASLAAVAQAGSPKSMKMGDKKVVAKNLSKADDSETVDLPAGTPVEVLLQIDNGEAIIRWKTGEADLKQNYLGVVQFSDLVKP